MPKIHPTAIVEDGSRLADGVIVGPYAFVGPEVVVGAGTQLMQGVIVEGKTTLGERNQIFPYSVLGTIPQDKKYQGEPTRLEIGDDNIIREHVTIHIGTATGIELTKVGNHNLIMASSHIGHDCMIGDHCVLANYAGLAGHVEIQDYAILGGQTGVHQFCRLGTHCITSGGSKVSRDVPPYTIAQGYPARLRGVNVVGLKRRGFSGKTVSMLRDAYRAVFFDSETPRFEDLLARVRNEFSGSHEVGMFLEFLETAQNTTRGFARPAPRGENSRDKATEYSGI